MLTVIIHNDNVGDIRHELHSILCGAQLEPGGEVLVRLNNDVVANGDRNVMPGGVGVKGQRHLQCSKILGTCKVRQ